MSRSGYSDDCDHLALWRQAVHRATTGYRGQHLLRRLRDALDAMPVKRLIADAIKDESGDVCALGALDPTVQGLDAFSIAEHFKVAHALVAEIVYMNDMAWTHRYETPEQRWVLMRAWVDSQIVLLTREEWLQRYTARFIVRARLTAEQAAACARAESFEVLSECFEDDPEGAADEEMSYWEP